MSENGFHNREGPRARAIQLAQDALDLCDQNGFSFAAIDLSSAIEKLKEVEEKPR